MTRNALLASAALLLCVAGTAEARGRSFSNSGSSRYVSNGKFGIGLELGAPSGFNGKYFLSPSTALNFGVGWIYDNWYRDGDGFHLYLDHLWHPVSLVENDAFKLPLYIGVGGRFWSFDDYRGRNDYDRSSAIGIRVPFGVAFDFNKIPLDVFIQLTFAADIFFGDYADRYDRRFGPNFGGSVGVRYWFD